jgi:Helix-turn-helix domain
LPRALRGKRDASLRWHNGSGGGAAPSSAASAWRADERLLKAKIMSKIARLMKRKRLTQAEAAALTGTAQLDPSNPWHNA